MATIRKRGEKWQVQLRRTCMTHITRSFHLKADALAWARLMEVEADRRDLPADPKALERITVRDLIEQYRDNVVSQKRACAVETIILNAMLRQPFAGKPLAEATPAVFSSYRDERLSAVKGVTIRRELALLQHAFDVARREWAIPLRNNPLASVKKPASEKPRERRLIGDELNRLLLAARSCRNKLISPLMRFAIETGMRRGEMLALRWQHIDWNRRTLHIPEAKNGHPRTIPLSSVAVAILTELPDSDADRAFPLTIEAVNLAWKRLTRRAGATDLHFHDLRHEAISRFFEMGLSIAEVALISGHRDVRQLFRYTHLRAEDVGRKLG